MLGGHIGDTLQDPGFTAKWGVTLVTRLFDTMDIDGSKSVSRDVSIEMDLERLRRHPAAQTQLQLQSLAETAFDTNSDAMQGFIAAAYSLSCGTTLSRPQGEHPQSVLLPNDSLIFAGHPCVDRHVSRFAVLFNMFDVGHRGEITQADFTAVFAEVCKAGIEPPRLCATLAPLTGSSGAAAAATRCDAPDDATDEMIAALGEIAGNSLHSFVRASNGVSQVLRLYAVLCDSVM